MELVPVDHDPFASPSGGGSGPQLIPVDHDPFAEKSTVTGLAKAAGTGFVKGAIGLAGLPGDAAGLLNRGIRYGTDLVGLTDDTSPKPDEELLGSGQIRRGVERASGPLYDPQTRGERFAETATSFIPAAVAGPGGFAGGAAALARRAILGGVAPGVASEAAGQAPGIEGTGLEPWARAAAAIGTGTGAAVLSRPASAQAALRNQLPDFVTDAHVARAHQLIDAAGQRGIALTWPEALSRVTGRPVLLDTQRIAESAPQSRGIMEEALGERAPQVAHAARNEFGTVGPQSARPSAIGPQVGEAADTAVNDIRQNINAVAEPFYNAARPVLLTAAEMNQVRAIPGFQEAANAVRNDPHLARYVQGLPEDSIGFLNEVKKHFDQQARNASSPLQPGMNVQRAASMAQSAGDVRAAAVAVPTSNAYETALNIERHGREQFLDPLLRGPLGRIADKDITTQKAIAALFPPNPLPNSQREISTTVAAVAATRPQAAAQLVRAHVESVFNEATQSLQGGPSQWGGAKFAAVLTGNPQQRSNLRAAVEALPNGHARWNGFENFLEVMEAIGKRQAKGSLTSFNTEELKNLSSGSFPAEIAKLGTSPGKWMSFVNDKWGHWQQGSNLREIAQIITNPGSYRLLGQISRMPPNSREAAVVAARIIAQGAGAAQRDIPSITVNPRPQQSQ